jgi:hypothetical protein
VNDGGGSHFAPIKFVRSAVSLLLMVPTPSFKPRSLDEIRVKVGESRRWSVTQ